MQVLEALYKQYLLLIQKTKFYRYYQQFLESDTHVNAFLKFGEISLHSSSLRLKFAWLLCLR